MKTDALAQQPDQADNEFKQVNKFNSGPITHQSKGIKMVLVFMTVFILGCANKNTAIKTNASQTLFFGGDIITMQGSEPGYVEAVVQDNGTIVFAGSLAVAESKFNAMPYDLNGNTLLPGFIDGHGHIYNVGLMSLFADILPPPDGPGADFDSIVTTTKNWIDSDNGQLVIEKFGWVIANGYDDSQLQEKDHPTAAILDQISTEYPVLIVHQSGHLGVVNTQGLKMAGYTQNSRDPEGGALRRDNKGQLNGVLEEAALFNLLMPLVNQADEAVQTKAIQMGQQAYAKSGYTTAQDGRTTPDASAAMATASRTGQFYIDVVSYPDIIWNEAAVVPEFYSKTEYNNHYRVGGVKLTLDGSPQGKTAWLTQHYHVPPTGQKEDYQGYAIMSDEEATKWIKKAYSNDWQILAHINGDAAIDQYISAMRAAQNEFGYNDNRSVIIHGQTLRKDQIPDLVDLNIYPSLFPMHTFYWGDWHRESVLGEQRAAYISPTRDVIDAGLTITSHHDAPVTFPNSMRVLDATVNRVTRTGFVLGPDQRISVYEGLKTLTHWAAIQHFEELKKGTIEVGKLADFVILNENPLKIRPTEIKDIMILKALKEGKEVYSQ